MDEHDDVSGGFSSNPRSDVKIGGDELGETKGLCKTQHLNPIPNSGNTGHASKDTGKANDVSQVGHVSLSNKSEVLLGQEVKSCSSKLDVNVGCEKGALVQRCVALKSSGLELNAATAVSSCLSNDLSSSVCSSRRSDKPSSISECMSSNVPVEENDPMKLWKAMKQNGFLSNPHGGISAAPSSCLVSSSHGGIPAPRKRGRKSKNNEAAMAKKRKIEIARKEESERFARLAAPSGLLNELNPGIINHVRNKKQVLSIIENIVKSDKDSGNFNHNSTSRHSNITTVEASRSVFSQGFKYGMPGDSYSTRYNGEVSEENNTAVSRFQVASENVSSLTSGDISEVNCNSVLTVKAATVASQWLELLHQDIKGRVTALRRSRKRVRAVVMTELPFLLTKEFTADQENEPNLLLGVSSKASTVDIHKNRWMALFNQLEQTLSEEEKQLENRLNQVRELQSHCDQGLQHLSLSSGQNFLQLGMPLDSRASNALLTDKDLVVKAAAASIFSTCTFLASKENITCT